MAAFARTELDMIGLARQDNQAAVTLFVIRDGKMIGRDVYLLDAAREASDDEVLASFLEQYYARATSIPREVYVPAGGGGGIADLQAFLAERRGGPVHLRVPRARREARAHGTGRRATRRSTLAREHARWLADQGKTLAALEQLAEALGLPGPPMRIECYDISNFQGAESVGSMVVFEDGKPRSGEYRRFRIRTVEGPNDFASHQEVLRRRFRGDAVRRGGQRGGAPLGDARPRHRRRRQGPGQRGQGGPGRARSARPAAGRPGQGARGAVPARPRGARSCCRRRRRRSISSSGCATRRTGSPSRTTARCVTGGRSARRSTTCPASARSASASC